MRYDSLARLQTFAKSSAIGTVGESISDVDLVRTALPGFALPWNVSAADEWDQAMQDPGKLFHDSCDLSKPVVVTILLFNSDLYSMRIVTNS